MSRPALRKESGKIQKREGEWVERGCPTDMTRGRRRARVSGQAANEDGFARR